MGCLYDNEEYRQMKREVMEAYDGYSWKWKVNHMKPGQVIAIWNSIRQRKLRLNKESKEYEQLSLFDMYPEIMTGVAR